MTETAGAITCPTCTAALPTVGSPCPRCTSAYAPAAGLPYPSAPYPTAPYPVGTYPATPYPPAPYPPMAYPPAPYAPMPYPVRPQKSAGVAILLTLLWIGAGHLYLDQTGTGLALMAGHFFLGVILLFVFAPLGFLVWLAAAVACSVWCSNMVAEINTRALSPYRQW